MTRDSACDISRRKQGKRVSKRPHQTTILATPGKYLPIDINALFLSKLKLYIRFQIVLKFSWMTQRNKMKSTTTSQKWRFLFFCFSRGGI